MFNKISNNYLELLPSKWVVFPLFLAIIFSGDLFWIVHLSHERHRLLHRNMNLQKRMANFIVQSGENKDIQFQLELLTRAMKIEEEAVSYYSFRAVSNKLNQIAESLGVKMHGVRVNSTQDHSLSFLNVSVIVGGELSRTHFFVLRILHQFKGINLKELRFSQEKGITICHLKFMILKK